MSLPKKIALPLYSITLVLFAVSPFYFLNKYLNTNKTTGNVLGDTSCSCNCNGSAGSFTSKYCGSKGSAGYQEISGTCYAIEGHCNAEATDNGNSCNTNHYYTETAGTADASNCGGGGGACNISSCVDAGGNVCNFGTPTSCSGMGQSLCETHRGSDCHWTGSSCTCDPNQGNVGGGDCGYHITYSDSHACSGGNSASLTATITKNDPSKCPGAVDVTLNAGSYSCQGADYADGTCRTCGGSGSATVTIPANQSSITHNQSCSVPNNCGSCQVDINGTGTLVYDNSGCAVTPPPPPPPPSNITLSGKAYCVIKATGQKEYKQSIPIKLGDNVISGTDQGGSWSASVLPSSLTNKTIKPNGYPLFPDASATDLASKVDNGIGCQDSNIVLGTYDSQSNKLVEVSGGCSRTLDLNQLNFNLGYCPIPDCVGLTGPKELEVGKTAKYNVSFTKSVPNSSVTGVGVSIIKGSISAGNHQCNTDTQPGYGYIVQEANLATSTNTFEWTPKFAGTYSIYGRIWNDGITECKAACVDGPPRYECQNAPSCRVEVTVKEPEAPLPNFSCDDLLMSFENASGTTPYNEGTPNIPKGYKGNIVLTCNASSDSSAKINKVKFQLSKDGAIIKSGESLDIKELTASGATQRKFVAEHKFYVDGVGKFQAASLACITFNSVEYCK